MLRRRRRPAVAAAVGGRDLNEAIDKLTRRTETFRLDGGQRAHVGIGIEHRGPEQVGEAPVVTKPAICHRIPPPPDYAVSGFASRYAMRNIGGGGQMATLRSLLTLYGALDLAVMQATDPGVVETVNQYLPNASA